MEDVERTPIFNNAAFLQRNTDKLNNSHIIEIMMHDI